MGQVVVPLARHGGDGGGHPAEAVQKAVIDFLLLFMMFFISRVSDHKNATFAKDLRTDGSV